MTLVDYNNEFVGTPDKYGFYGDQWEAQVFTASATYTIQSIKILCYRNSSGSPGTITASIRATSAGKPTGGDLVSGTYDGDTLTTDTNGEWITITFSSTTSLTSGTKYAMVLRCTGATSLDNVLWRFDPDNAYTTGEEASSLDAGSTWDLSSDFALTDDFEFETYGVVGSLVIRMIPFIYSASIAYQCEFRDSYIRFYYDDAVLQDGGSDVYISSPYAQEDLYELQYYQIGDTMWIVHPSYKPRKLTRTSATTFSLDVIEYNNGPFLTRNDLIDTTVQGVASMSYNAGALTCDGEVFESGHVGALFKLTHPRPVTNVSLSGAGYSDPISGKGTYQLITRGTWTGIMQIQRNDNNTGWYTFRTYKSSSGAEQNIKESFKEEDDNVQYRLYATSGTSASYRGDLSTQDYLQDSIVKVTAVTDTQNATATPIVPVPSTDSTKRWAEGAWSDVRTYPSSITFFNDRCILAGQQAIPSQILIKPEEPE